MKLASHEVHQLSELTLSCVNSITNMALFLSCVKDAQLKSLIEKHFPFHIKDYNTKVEYLTRADGAKTGLPIPEFTKILDCYTKSPVQPQPVTPRIKVEQLEDREIATGYMLTLKRAGREYAWAAMEMSNPEIRCFCENAFVMASHHAFDIWQWMVQKGYYPLDEAPQNELSMIGGMYGVVKEESAPKQ
jgi:spore coat protein CotF